VTPRFTGRPSDGCSAGPIGANERRREVSASDVSVAAREPRPGSSLPPDDTPSRSARALRAGQSDRASRSRSAHPSPIRGTRRAPSVRSRPGSSGGPGQSGHPWSDAAASPRNRRDAANPLEPRGMRARHRGDRGSSTSRDVILERSWNARAASGGNRRRGQVGVNPPSATNRDQWGPTPALQAGGHRFDPGTLHPAHQQQIARNPRNSTTFPNLQFKPLQHTTTPLATLTTGSREGLEGRDRVTRRPATAPKRLPNRNYRNLGHQIDTPERA
jgi:hypothetical protein